jgi:hypothetical protein
MTLAMTFINSSNDLLCHISARISNVLDHPATLLKLLNLLNLLDCDIKKSLNDVTMLQSLPLKSDQHHLFGTEGPAELTTKRISKLP